MGFRELVIIGIIVIAAGSFFSAPNIEPLEFETQSHKQYEFRWSSPEEPYLSHLSAELELGKVVSGYESELEKVQLVASWVHDLWDHDGSNQPEQSDPLSIVREAREEGKNFRCVEYSIVINGCLNALGIPSRVVGLKTEDVETRKSGAGHVVVEAYLEEYGKWVFIDGQWNAVPMLGETPLHAVEFQKALAEGKKGLTVAGFSAARKKRYLNWIAEYLFYFDATMDNRFTSGVSNQKLMLVPLGAKKPEVFQREWPIGNVIYTHSVHSFYPEPEIEQRE